MPRQLSPLFALAPISLGLILTGSAFAQPATTLAAASATVRDVTTMPATGLQSGTVLFNDHRQTGSINPDNGLIAYIEWRKARPEEAAALAPHPDYAEPNYAITVNGETKQRHETLKIYVAQGRFVVDKPAASIDLARFASLDFVSKMDGSIRQKRLDPAEVTPTKDPAAAFARRPDRAWCTVSGSTCLESRYDLEGKLPLGVKLANKLELGSSKKIAEFVSFQSELRVLNPSEAAPLAELTGIGTPVAGALEQTIFWVNQILRFGKFLAVMQPSPDDPGKTIVATYMALAIKADVLERKQEYARVPVLKNLLPVQVLMGNSSFNTGASISAGLPTYARNRIAAFAESMAKP